MIYNVDLPCLFEESDFSGAERGQFLGGGLGSIMEFDKGNDRFAKHRVRHSDNGGFGDSRVFENDIFKFGRIDVLSAANDHVIFA